MKKYLIGSLTVLTVMWAMGLSLLVAAPASAAVGDLVKSASSPTVYVVGADGVTIMPFPHANVYSSWGYPADFSTVMTKDLSSYTVGPNVEFRSGSLVKGDGPAVYYIENRTKRPIISDVVFLALGWDWNDITWLSDAFLADYPTGSPISSSSMHPDGSLVKYAGSPAVYLIDGGKKRPFASAAAFEANRYNWADVITIPDTETYPDGSPITGYEQALSLPQGVGAASQQTGSGLTVSVSPMNPAATTIIADNSGTAVGQSLVPFLAVNFTASSDGDVKVTSLRFKRKGISTDSDILNTYLYDSNMNRLALGGSLSSNYLTFNDPNGLFTVPAGTTYTVYLRADLSQSVSSGKTIGFDIESSSDVTTDGAAVAGSFPVSGNFMTTATVSDLGYASFGTPNPTGNANVDPGQTNFEVWSDTVMAGDQDIELRRIKFTNVGSIQQDDLQNFYLYANGVQVAGPVQMNADREVIFDLSGSPLAIDKGVTKTLSLRADIVKGATRTFKFTIQYQDDVLVWDVNYGVYTQPYGGTSWSVIQPAGTYTINAGSITVSRAADSPTGNVAQGATNVHLARFNFDASGEDIKISNLLVSVDTVNNGGLDNGRVVVNGTQVGSTSDLAEWGSTPTTFNFGSSFIAKAGETTVVDIYADIKTSTSSQVQSGNLTVYLQTGSSNGQGVNSLQTMNVPSSNVMGNTLSVQAGKLSVTTNAAYGNQTMVPGTQNARVGSFIITAGSAEGVTVTSITVNLSSDEAASTTNMKLMKDGAQIGSTIANPSTSNLFSGFSFDIPASGSVVIDIYADFKSNANKGPWQATINANGVSGIGKVTGNSVSAPSSNLNLQTITISNGSLSASLDASAPDADIILAGASKVHMNAIKFTALYEDFEVQEITFTVPAAAADNVAKVIIEYPTQNGGTGTAEGYLSNGSVTFTGLNMFVPRNDSAVMHVYIDTTTITNGADSGDEFSVDFDATSSTYKHQGLGSGNVETNPANVASGDIKGNDMVVRKTRPTITLASLPTTSLTADGNYTIFKFTVSADNAEDVSWSRIGLDVALNGIGYTTVSIYDANNQSTALSASSTATTTSQIIIDLTNEEIIPAGGSKTYIVKAYLTGVNASGDSITTNIKAPYGTTVTDDWNTVATNEKAFIWSDNSAIPHSFTSSDWANAEYVKTLPSDTQSLSKQ